MPTMCNACVIEIRDFKKCFHLSTGKAAKWNTLKLEMYVHQSNNLQEFEMKLDQNNRTKIQKPTICNQCMIEIL